MAEDMCDVAIRIQGLRDVDQAAREWPAIIRSLGRVQDCVKRLRPAWRRSPLIDDACDWAWRAVHDAPVAEELREQALEVIATIKSMVGPVTVLWRPAPPARRAQSGPAQEKGRSPR
jgi:hypothetical protein